MKVPHVTKGSVFADLGFSQVEAANLKMRADLMLAMKRHIEKKGLTQTKAAVLFHVDQPQISRLLKGEIDHFSIDKLINMLAYADIRVIWKIAA